MTIKEAYEIIGDYNDVESRLMSENIIKKFVLMFPDDNSFDNLKNAVKENDIETAFRAVHTLKGVVANLSFTPLYNAASDLTEQLRPKNSPIDMDLYKKVVEVYEQVISVIKKID